MKKNSLDLNNVKPECIEIRDEILRLQKRIDKIKPTYDRFNKKLMLNKGDALMKSDLGHELYDLNIKIISRIQELAICQEGRNLEDQI